MAAVFLLTESVDVGVDDQADDFIQPQLGVVAGEEFSVALIEPDHPPRSGFDR
jgi:hypothetical protein